MKIQNPQATCGFCKGKGEENEKEEISQNYKKVLNEKDARINFLEENMQQTVELLRQKENLIELMKNSTSWKITEPLRKLRSNKKENKK